MNLTPDKLSQFQHVRAYRGGKVEVLIERVLVLHCDADTQRQISTVSVMANLISIPQDMYRVLSFEDLLHQVGHNVRHGKLDVSAPDVMVAKRTLLAYTDAIERPQDRIRQFVLLIGALCEELCGQFLKTVGGAWRRTTALSPFRCW